MHDLGSDFRGVWSDVRRHQATCIMDDRLEFDLDVGVDNA